MSISSFSSHHLENMVMVSIIYGHLLLIVMRGVVGILMAIAPIGRASLNLLVFIGLGGMINLLALVIILILVSLLIACLI